MKGQVPGSLNLTSVKGFIPNSKAQNQHSTKTVSVFPIGNQPQNAPFPGQHIKAEDQHANYFHCYLSKNHSNVSVYEYMPNGNMFEAFHNHNGLD